MNQQIPEVFRPYDKNLKKISHNGLIKIQLATSKNSKTVIKNLQTKAPFLIQKAMYPDSNLPNTAHIYLMSSAGGILQGDNLKIDIVAGKNTSTHITTQAATKIYKMENGYASQHIDISLEEGSYLEFIPNQIIPYKSSRFYQEVNLKISKNSLAIYSETISAGRMAYGEKFDFDLYFLRMNVVDENNNLLFSDIMNMQPTKNKTFESLFGNKTILSTMYIITNSNEHEKIYHEIDLLIKSSSVLASCSTLPNDSGIVMRMLSNSIDEITTLTKDAVNIVRIMMTHFYNY